MKRTNHVKGTVDTRLFSGKREIPNMNFNACLYSSFDELQQPLNSIFDYGYALSIVSGGYGVLVKDGIEHMLHTGDVFFIPVSDIPELRNVSGLKIYGCLMTADYVNLIAQESPLDIQTICSLKDNFLIHATEEDMKIFHTMHVLLENVAKKEASELKNVMMHNLYLTFSIEVYMIYEARNNDLTPEKMSYNSATMIFKRFIEIMQTSEKPIHTVCEVAEQLNITPKYFSTVCKQITGRTALDIINSELVKNARLLLLNPNNSVKQVSVRLGFANQSHFGTFMRRNAGMSPLKYRQSLLNKDNQA